jgi:hypothetical protein
MFGRQYCVICLRECKDGRRFIDNKPALGLAWTRNCIIGSITFPFGVLVLSQKWQVSLDSRS